MFYWVLNKGALLSLLLCGVVYGVSDFGAELQIPVEPAALEAAGIRALQQSDPNLDGSGVVIAAVCRSMTYLNGIPQNDYRFNMRHNSLSNADVLFEDHSDGGHGVSAHATAIAGILIGLDEQAERADGTLFSYRGVAPYASVDVYEFWRFAALWLFGQKAIPADIITLSLGDMFEDWWTRAIEQRAAENGTVVIAAIGNGQAARDPLLYPAAGANVIGVGVIDSVLDETGNPVAGGFSVPTALHSSTGPTYDGRSKPDLVAPGTAIVPDAYTEGGYTTLTNASSLAAPMAAGVAALLLQQIAQTPSLAAAMEDAPINCLIRAVLMNSARKLPYWHKGEATEEDDLFTPLDRLQGAGALDAEAAMRQLTASRQEPGNVSPLGWDSRPLVTEETLYYVFEAGEPGAMLTATLTWNRHYEDRYPFQPKTEQSDLRLELWGITPDGSVLLDVSDSPDDTVEHLWTPLSGGYSHYMIAVRFSPEATQPPPAFERFALAWSVGPDTSIGHPLWHDLNGDGVVNVLDRFLQTLLIQENGRLDRLHPDFREKALKLSPERAALLTTLWPRWQPYLTAE